MKKRKAKPSTRFPNFPDQADLGEASFSLGYLEGSIRGLYERIDSMSKDVVKEWLLALPSDLESALEARQQHIKRHALNK